MGQISITPILRDIEVAAGRGRTFIRCRCLPSEAEAALRKRGCNVTRKSVERNQYTIISWEPTPPPQPAHPTPPGAAAGAEEA